MKQAILILIVLLFLTSVVMAKSSGLNNVPEEVLKAFSEKYKGAKIRNVKKQNDTEIIKFVINKRKDVAIFLSNGTWVKTETKLPWSWDLPSVVRKRFNNCEFKAWYIDEIEAVESPGNKIYSIQVSYDYGPIGSIPGDFLDVYKLYYDKRGKLIKTEHLRD